MILSLLGIIIYQAITKKYKFSTKKLIKFIIGLCIVAVITPCIWAKFGQTEEEKYINSIIKSVQENKSNINIKYDEKNNTLICTSNDFTVSNGTLDEYLDEYVKGNEKVVAEIENLKNSYTKLCNSLVQAQSKFYDVNMDVIVKCIEKKSGKDMFLIKNDNLEYDILENVEKLKVEKDKEIKETKNKSKENQSSNIPKKIANLYKIKYGELLDATENNNVLIIKTKITPSMNNKLTIDQNGYNIEDLIVNQGADLYDEIQYWAVADMEDGTESKVISFTVDKNLINSIKNKNTVANQIINQAKDVWILPSLSK